MVKHRHIFGPRNVDKIDGGKEAEVSKEIALWCFERLKVIWSDFFDECDGHVRVTGNSLA